MGEDLKEILPHLMDIKESLGGLSAEVRATNSHINSVSKKADGIRGDLDTHLDDIAAHGQKAVSGYKEDGRASRADWFLAATFLVSVIALIFSMGVGH